MLADSNGYVVQKGSLIQARSKAYGLFAAGDHVSFEEKEISLVLKVEHHKTSIGPAPWLWYLEVLSAKKVFCFVIGNSAFRRNFTIVGTSSIPTEHGS